MYYEEYTGRIGLNLLCDRKNIGCETYLPSNHG